MTLQEALEKYVDKFKRNFPIMMMRGTPTSEIIKLIEDALKTGVPFELPEDDSESPPLY